MITVGLIDDHDLFRSSLSALLSAQKGFSVSVEAESGQVFFNRMVLQDAVPDIAITDYLMPAVAKSPF
ncbi:MAG: response regulator transcription factor [Sediminibacterium sp.]